MNRLTEQDALKMITVIRENYQGAYNLESEDEIRLILQTWVECFEGYDREAVAVAFKEAIKNCRYAPTIADIISILRDYEQSGEASDNDLWSMLDRAIYDTATLVGRFEYTAIPMGSTLTQGEMARREFYDMYEGLDPLIKDFLSSPQQLIHLSNLTLEQIGYEKSRFFKALPNLRQRARVRNETNPEILALCQGGLRSFNDIDKPAVKKIGNVS